MKKILLFFIVLLKLNVACAQWVFHGSKLPEEVSILDKSEIADAGFKSFQVEQVKDNKSGLHFRKIKGQFGNLGFTDHTYWIRFQIHNATAAPLQYYLETSEPVTDNVNLYTFPSIGKKLVQRSGDNLGFYARDQPFRSTIFKILLRPHEKLSYLLEVKNDGEKNSLPLRLFSPESLLQRTYQSQMILGIFYGLLLVIIITYFFFYLALKERSFLYYTCYVFSIFLCQCALDGFLHQFIFRDNSWINLHAVIITAIAGAFFFGKYTEMILNIKDEIRSIYKALQLMYLTLGIVLAAVLFINESLTYAYPVINLITLIGMSLIGLAVGVKLLRGRKVEIFFVLGISILFLCLLLVILRNFGVSFPAPFIDNISKIGIGLQILALSLSMAKRIGTLKSKAEELNILALQRSEEMNDVKSYFMSTMSHELRTPLNAIVGLTSIIDAESKDPETKAKLQLIKSASDSLLSSLNDIFDFAKIEKGELRIDKVSFSGFEVVEKLRKRFFDLALEKGLAFEFASNMKSNVSIIGDPARLEQVLNNLLDNAVKFTSSGAVSFDIEANVVAGNQLQLLVVIGDTGIGIPESKLAGVFDLFSQVEADNKRRFGGFGLGLGVVKTLVELQDGTIKLASKVGFGTTCTIELRYPIDRVIQTVINKFPSEHYDLLGHKILVVEDNKMNQMVLKMMFKKWENNTVIFAEHGGQAISALQAQQIDLILMDLQMPVMDGYEAIAAIRSGLAGEENTDLPIIALTADLMDSSKQKVFDLGVNDFMTKPVDQELLYSKITVLLSQTMQEVIEG
ncbi:MAG: hybrid sensor histidine kinase/response regulator [Pedobacter sp.]|nr:hybrid sensor histidine kinase/response regulator [Pedobacter sp.]